MNPILAVDHISHAFRGLHVLRNVSFQVGEHTISGLIGPNGAGKSTLFNIISGFLRPLAGRVFYAGRAISTHTIQQRSLAGLVRTFQTPQLFAHLTVGENLMAGCHKNGRSGLVSSLLGLPRPRRELAAAERAAEMLCGQFGLTEVRHHLAGKLPTGQQRLLELARAVIGGPRLLCLDEPSSGLSQHEVTDLMATLRRLNADGMTILLVSHDMELMSISSMIHVLCFGEIIASGRFAQIQGDARVREAYLGT
jgi:branched-chain amino acid transport system ATP-binding protein/nonpolar-amino-acid-transporting ATPase